MAIRPSLRLALLLLLSHATAATVVCVTTLPLAARLAMLVLILSSLIYYLARDILLLLPDSWCKISLDQDSVLLATRNGLDLIGKVMGKTTVSPYFIVLCVRLEGKRLPVYRTIFRDALDAGAYRELCVRLRYSWKLL